MAVLCLTVWAVESETTLENSNFTLSSPIQGEREMFNYHRIRLMQHVRTDNWFATAIGDIENYLGQDYIHSREYTAASALRSDTPFSTQTGTYHYGEGELYAQLFRLYGGYSDTYHRISIGLQKLSFGVGRIWNPIDMFNPKNPLALEPDEVYGTFSAAYTYTPGDLRQINVIAAQRSDQSFKYAGRIKGYTGFADIALSGVSADDMTMVGYEIEGELLKSGIGIRSEGGYFNDKLLDRRYFQGIIGVDYGFEKSLIIVAEWLHTSRTFGDAITLALPSGSRQNLVRSHDYGALNAGYQIDPLVYGSCTTIVNVEDGSYYFSPSLRYSLDDDVSLSAGAMMFGGVRGSEFGRRGETLYLNLKMTY